MENELMVFDYEAVDVVTAGKLKKHETAIRNIQSKAVYEIGEELKAAHDELADHNGGTFYAWCRSIGFNTSTVKNILNYHEYVSQNLTNGDLIESLPKSLVYEAARPSTPQELKDGVANGDITSLPEFKKLKAELEATKNVLRTTESKLTSAEQERDDEKRKNADLDSIRANIMKQNADYAQENHMLKMDNNALAHENEQLRNQPQAEPEIRVVEKRVEVIPDEYKKAFMENQQLKKELAAHRAHAQNMTVQELAQTDKEFDDLQKSYEEEERTSKRLEYFETLSSFFPEGQIEARELARCFLKFHGNEPAIVHTVQQNLRLAIDSMTWIYDALTAKPKLEVVK